MTSSLIIILCSLLLLAYLFDISSAKTKIPTVIFLLLMGWLVRQATIFFELSLPDFGQLLPLLGTIGLILIVLEGSLELELNRSKLPLIGKTVIMALAPLLLLAFGLAYALHYASGASVKDGLANAIPLAIISSAIAIPSVRNLSAAQREFVTYESSLSDIFGVLFFNFIVLNETIGSGSFRHFIVELVLMLAITFAASLLLAFLLSRIRHHVKFIPVILMILLIYSIAKYYHLPALIFILLFGLFVGNLDEFRNRRFVQLLKPEQLDKEMQRFKDITGEIVFLIRSLFFLLFGFLIETREVMDSQSLLWALCICAAILVLRFLFLKLSGTSTRHLLYIAPRGLITILLFLGVPDSQRIPIVSQSLIIQVIIIMALVMMMGLLRKPLDRDMPLPGPDAQVPDTGEHPAVNMDK